MPYPKADMAADSERELVDLLAKMHAEAEHAGTFHAKAQASLDFLRSRPRLERFKLLDIISNNLPPASSSLSDLPRAGD